MPSDSRLPIKYHITLAIVVLGQEKNVWIRVHSKYSRVLTSQFVSGLLAMVFFFFSLPNLSTDHNISLTLGI